MDFKPIITLRKLGIMPIVYGKERKGLSVRGKAKVRRDDDDLSDDDQKRFNRWKGAFSVSVLRELVYGLDGVMGEAV